MDSNKLADVTSRIVSAYVGNNSVPKSELTSIIESVAASVRGLEKTEEPPVVLVPAVPVNQSVTDDYIICLEDGKRFKTMRRHLNNLGMTPEQYRKKWGLPKDYPIVSKSYSLSRVDIAKKTGLGRRVKGSKK